MSEFRPLSSVILLALAWTASSAQSIHPDAESVPATGTGLPVFDLAVSQLMVRRNIPGLSLAIAKDGRLIVAQGFGYADVHADEPVQPDSLFRIASISKSITAISSMKLVESGHIGLGDPVIAEQLPVLYSQVAPDQAFAVSSITLADLLNHTSGWQFRTEGRDVVFENQRIAAIMGVASPPDSETVIEHVLANERLRRTPGTSFYYDNFNYMLAGRVIESVAGRDYEDFVRSRVLAPIGVHRARIGGSLEFERLPGEVRYYGRGSEQQLVQPVFENVIGLVPLPYGGWNHRGLDSVGGWVASAADLVRLMVALDADPLVPDLLDATSRERIGRNPGPPVFPSNSQVYYALGWERGSFGDVWYHGGSLPGTRTFILMWESGYQIAVLTNTRETGAADVAYMDDLVTTMDQAMGEVVDWPDRDLFADLGYEQFVVTDEISGAWFDSTHDGEGFLIEILSADRAVVYWFTYNDAGNQRWFVGEGSVSGNRIDVADLWQPEGGRFGALANNIELHAVGSLSLEFDGCDAGQAAYAIDGVQGSQQLTRLIRINGQICPEPGDPTELTFDVSRTSSGSWLDPSDPGEGFIVQRISEQAAAVFWFTFDEAGKQRWMTGVGSSEDGNWRFDDLFTTSGGEFGSAFDPASVKRIPWGSLILDLACSAGQASFEPMIEGFSGDALDLTRLTYLAGQLCTDR